VSSQSIVRGAPDVRGDGLVDAPPTGAQPNSHLKRRRRGWLVRRMLLLADLLGLATAFGIAQAVYAPAGGDPGHIAEAREYLLFLATLPVWVIAAKLAGLYERDEERTDHSTVDDLVRVFHLVTASAWLLFAGSWLTNAAEPNLPKLFAFWALAIALVTSARAGARAYCQRRPEYQQNTLIVGAGDVGQLIARKLAQHPEYGINLVGFVDDEPKDRRADLGELDVLGGVDRLRTLVVDLDVERVVVAFSNDAPKRTLAIVRSLSDLEVQIDIVPRLFELVNPNVTVHTVEGLPLVGLPPVKLSRSSSLLKRAIDVIAASVGLVLMAPLFIYSAWRIKRESPGPVFFRQTRLGRDMREFTAYKFRTMTLDANDETHRDYIRNTMSAQALVQTNGLYKLDRDDAITPFGRWLRRTSLDELPQLINVLRGDMSLVGPRPCIPYETEFFAPHHFERFLVPQGLTGLWQVTARARSTFGEALDMDVAYARGWSLGLDLRLLWKTPLQLLRGEGTR
jgi:exopolysaccharide biosynthesis polyprenyl glycosylphosphotransferase